MKLVEVVGVMNIADVRVASKTIRELLPERPLDMRHSDADPSSGSTGRGRSSPSPTSASWASQSGLNSRNALRGVVGRCPLPAR